VLDLRQREIDVPRDAGFVNDANASRRGTPAVTRPNERAASPPACMNRENEMRTEIAGSLLLSACLLAAASSAMAQALPEPVEQNGAVYVTGGIGAEEVAAFRAAAPRYNLRITFATKGGHYLSDVDVMLTSGKSTVLDAHTAGPFLFARVPPGRYTVSAHDRAVQEVRHVVVPARGGVDVRFYWQNPERRGVMRLCGGCPGTGTRAAP